MEKYVTCVDCDVCSSYTKSWQQLSKKCVLTSATGFSTQTPPQQRTAESVTINRSIERKRCGLQVHITYVFLQPSNPNRNFINITIR